LKLFKQQDVEFNVLVVINSHNGDHGRRVYTYLRDNGVRYMQFIPIVERHGEGAHAEDDSRIVDSKSQAADLVSSRSVRPEQFGNFLVQVFDEWLRRDVGKVFVQIFDQALSAWMGMEPSLCVFRKECGRALAIEHNGDVYSCDHFVEPDHKLGNIFDLPLVERANSDRQLKFGADKKSTLPQYCRECEVQFACNGECPKNRFIETPSGEAGLNYLCAGYRKFFNHIDPIMRLMAEEVNNQRPAANVMHRLNLERRTNPKQQSMARTAAERSHQISVGASTGQRTTAGRNDPCPCNSGKKFKKCCGR
jgi:uncharacterized protein